MNTVNERLSKSKAAHCRELFQTGKSAGTTWAKDTAEYSELVKIKAIDASDYVEASGDREGAFEAIFAIAGEASSDRAEFASEVLGDEAADDDFAAGFIIGAQQYFETVEDQI